MQFIALSLMLTPSSASVLSLVQAVGNRGLSLSVDGDDPQMPGSHQAHKAWDETTKMSAGAEIIVASGWVLMLAAVPLLVKYLDGRPATKTQILVGGIMWLAIFGGYYLFTNIIIFQSGHFSPPRTLTIVECTYLMAQVITTVGYGDITPAHPRGQVFVGLYVIMALFVIANVMSDLVGHITESAARYKANMAASAQKEATEQSEEDREAARSKAALVVMKHAERPSVGPLLSASAAFGFLAVCWILFFHYYPGEEKTWLQAVYFSIITYSTVGFGWFTPSTQGGMVFASFFMIFGSSALVGVVACFTELMVKLGEYEKFDPDAAMGAIKDFQKTHKGDDMTEVDFLRFGFAQTGLVSEEDLAAAKSAFKALTDGSEDGLEYVSISALEKSMQ
jgi:hypothetical protein